MTLHIGRVGSTVSDLVRWAVWSERFGYQSEWFHRRGQKPKPWWGRLTLQQSWINERHRMKSWQIGGSEIDWRIQMNHRVATFMAKWLRNWKRIRTRSYYSQWLESCKAISNNVYENVSTQLKKTMKEWRKLRKLTQAIRQVIPLVMWGVVLKSTVA